MNYALLALALSARDSQCISILRASHYSLQQAQALCFQYTDEEKTCIARSYARTHDFRRIQEICLKVPGDDKGPALQPGLCQFIPNDIACQEGWER